MHPFGEKKLLFLLLLSGLSSTPVLGEPPFYAITAEPLPKEKPLWDGFDPKWWEAAKWAFVEHAAQVAEVNRGYETYYFQRDMDLSFATAWLLGEDIRSNLHEVNVSTTAWETENAKEYLLQEGLLNRQDPRPAVLLDIGMEGSILKGILSLPGATKGEIQLQFPNAPKEVIHSKTFQTTFEPQMGKLSVASAHSPVMRSYLEFIESLPRYHSSNQGYHQNESGKWKPTYEIHSAEVRALSEKLLKDLVYFVKRTDVIARYRRARKDWRELDKIARGTDYRQAREQVKRFIESHSNPEIAQAMVLDQLQVDRQREKPNAFSLDAYASQSALGTVRGWMPSFVISSQHLRNLGVSPPAEKRKRTTKTKKEWIRQRFPELPEKLLNQYNTEQGEKALDRWVWEQSEEGKWELLLSLYHRNQVRGPNLKSSMLNLLKKLPPSPKAIGFAMELLGPVVAAQHLSQLISENPHLLVEVEKQFTPLPSHWLLAKALNSKDPVERAELLQKSLDRYEELSNDNQFVLAKQLLGPGTTPRGDRLPGKLVDAFLSHSYQVGEISLELLSKQKRPEVRNYFYRMLFSQRPEKVRVAREILVGGTDPTEASLRNILASDSMNQSSIASVLLTLPTLNQATLSALERASEPEVRSVVAARRGPSPLKQIIEGCGFDLLY